MYSGYDSFYDEFAVLGGFIFVLVAVVLAFFIVVLVASCKLFKKAGKPGWAAIVPVYSYWVLTEIAGINWWWFLLALSDSIASLIGLEDLSSVTNLVSLFASFNIYYNVAKKFNKTTGTAVWAGIFSSIFVLIFGFSKNEVYDASIPVSKNGVFGNPESNNNVSQYNQPIQNEEMPVQDNDSSNDTNSDIIFCSNCGNKSSMNDKFCQNCGKELIK